VIVQEPDGRIWTFEPKGHFGGYERTLSKGRVDEGQTEQQAALRELWEETGLLGEITGDVGWYRGTTTMTHYFTARRTGGAPWAHDGHETAAVYLQAPEVAAAALQERDVNALRDAGIAHGHAEGWIRCSGIRAPGRTRCCTCRCRSRRATSRWWVRRCGIVATWTRAQTRRRRLGRARLC
jgi:8-oxo-dGTP pyrophosphatase MutT (NUDIX family)